MDIFHLHDESNKRPSELNNKVMVTALLCLTFVILLVTLLHIYARCILRHPRRNRTATALFINPTLAPQGSLQATKSGLDQTTINFIPSFPFNKTQGHEHIECAVCLSMLEVEELARRLPNCNHEFHMSCIDMWLSGQSTCPICRADATPRLVPHDREPPMGINELMTEVVVVSLEYENDHDVHQIVNSSKINDKNGTGLSSSSSFRMSSFRSIVIARERSSSSSNRV